MVIYRLGLPYYKEFDNFQFVGLRCRGGYNGSFGFPLWGKLSPQVTDEGELAGHFPLIRRIPRHLPPKGNAFPAAGSRAGVRRINQNLYIKENIDETVFMFALFKCRKFDKRRN